MCSDILKKKLLTKNKQKTSRLAVGRMKPKNPALFWQKRGVKAVHRKSSFPNEKNLTKRLFGVNFTKRNYSKKKDQTIHLPPKEGPFSRHNPNSKTYKSNTLKKKGTFESTPNNVAPSNSIQSKYPQKEKAPNGITQNRKSLGNFQAEKYFGNPQKTMDPSVNPLKSNSLQSNNYKKIVFLDINNVENSSTKGNTLGGANRNNEKLNNFIPYNEKKNLKKNFTSSNGSRNNSKLGKNNTNSSPSATHPTSRFWKKNIKKKEHKLRDKLNIGVSRGFTEGESASVGLNQEENDKYQNRQQQYKTKPLLVKGDRPFRGQYRKGVRKEIKNKNLNSPQYRGRGNNKGSRRKQRRAAFFSNKLMRNADFRKRLVWRKLKKLHRKFNKCVRRSIKRFLRNKKTIKIFFFLKRLYKRKRVFRANTFLKIRNSKLWRWLYFRNRLRKKKKKFKNNIRWLGYRNVCRKSWKFRFRVKGWKKVKNEIHNATYKKGKFKVIFKKNILTNYFFFKFLKRAFPVGSSILKFLKQKKKKQGIACINYTNILTEISLILSNFIEILFNLRVYKRSILQKCILSNGHELKHRSQRVSHSTILTLSNEALMLGHFGSKLSNSVVVLNSLQKLWQSWQQAQKACFVAGRKENFINNYGSFLQKRFFLSFFKRFRAIRKNNPLIKELKKEFIDFYFSKSYKCLSVRSNQSTQNWFVKTLTKSKKVRTKKKKWLLLRKKKTNQKKKKARVSKKNVLKKTCRKHTNIGSSCQKAFIPSKKKMQQFKKFFFKVLKSQKRPKTHNFFFSFNKKKAFLFFREVIQTQQALLFKQIQSSSLLELKIREKNKKSKEIKKMKRKRWVPSIANVGSQEMLEGPLRLFQLCPLMLARNKHKFKEAWIHLKKKKLSNLCVWRQFPKLFFFFRRKLTVFWNFFPRTFSVLFRGKNNIRFKPRLRVRQLKFAAINKKKYKARVLKRELKEQPVMVLTKEKTFKIETINGLLFFKKKFKIWQLKKKKQNLINLITNSILNKCRFLFTSTKISKKIQRIKLGVKKELKKKKWKAGLKKSKKLTKKVKSVKQQKRFEGQIKKEQKKFTKEGGVVFKRSKGGLKKGGMPLKVRHSGSKGGAALLKKQQERLKGAAAVLKERQKELGGAKETLRGGG